MCRSARQSWTGLAVLPGSPRNSSVLMLIIPAQQHYKLWLAGFMGALAWAMRVVALISAALLVTRHKTMQYTTQNAVGARPRGSISGPSRPCRFALLQQSREASRLCVRRHRAGPDLGAQETVMKYPRQVREDVPGQKVHMTGCYWS